MKVARQSTEENAVRKQTPPWILHVFIPIFTHTFPKKGRKTQNLHLNILFPPAWEVRTSIHNSITSSSSSYFSESVSKKTSVRGVFCKREYLAFVVEEGWLILNFNSSILTMYSEKNVLELSLPIIPRRILSLSLWSLLWLLLLLYLSFF